MNPQLSLSTLLPFVLRPLFGLCCSCLALAGCGGTDDSEADPTSDLEVGVAEQPLLDGFMLRNTNTSRCLSAAASSGSDAFLPLPPASHTQGRHDLCDPSDANQRWIFDGGFLKNAARTLCLDIENAATNDGARAQVFRCNGAANQDFRFFPLHGDPVVNWVLVVKHSGKCIDPGEDAGSSGERVVQSSACLGAWNVLF